MRPKLSAAIRSSSPRYAALKVSSTLPRRVCCSRHASPALHVDRSGLVVSLLRFDVCKVLRFRAAGAARGWFKNSSFRMLLLVMLPDGAGETQVKRRRTFI